MSDRLSLPQAELIADAATNRCWRYDDRDYATGTHSHRDVTRTVTALVGRGLLAQGEPQPSGWTWRPTTEGLQAARDALLDLRDRADIALRLLGRGELPAQLGEAAAWRVLAELADERARQDAKWGEQNHPDGTGPDIAHGFLGRMDEHARHAQLRAQGAAMDGTLTWHLILLEEVYEGMAESDPVALRAELIQVAAVAVAWIEAIDRRLPAAAPASTANQSTTEEADHA